MSYTKQDLLSHFHIPGETDTEKYTRLDECIVACELNKDKNDYDEAELNRLQQYWDIVIVPQVTADYTDLRNEGHAHEEALNIIQELYDQSEVDQNIATSSKDVPPARRKQQRKSNLSQERTLSLFELIEQGKQKTGKPLTLSRVSEFLKISGLTEQDSYSPPEVEKFLSTCDQVINQGKSYQEVSEYHGVTGLSAQLLGMAAKTSTEARENLKETAVKTAAQTQKQFLELTNRMIIREIGEMVEDGSLQQAIISERNRLLAESDYINVDVIEDYERWEADRRKSLPGDNGSKNGSKSLPEGKKP